MVEGRSRPCDPARRRRNKTVHFGEAVQEPRPRADEEPSNMGSTASGSNTGSVNSLPGQFEANVRQLFDFIGNVLSAWDRPPSNNNKKRRSPKDAVKMLLKGDSRLTEEENFGSPSYKHKHWKIPPGSCTALFLTKVSFIKYSFS